MPAHWDVRRGKHLMAPVDIRSKTGGEELLTVSAQHGVIPRETANVTMFKAESYVGYKLCWPGDLVINSLWAWAHGLGVSQHHGIVSSAYGVYRAFPTLDARFLHLLVRSIPFQWELQVRSKGIWMSRLQLTDESFLSAPFPLPPLHEQRAIVRYLDRADDRILRYLDAQRRLVALLEEERQATINQAVTRGLDADAPLKPSGIEWLGDVPAHWEIGATKRIYEIRLGKMLQSEPRVSNDVRVPYLKAVHVQWDGVNVTDAPLMWASPREVERYSIANGDLLVCEGGEGGRCSILDNVPDDTIIQNALHRVRPIAGWSNQFLYYVMRAISETGFFDAINDKATIAHFTKEKFDALRIPLPPIPEQRAIVRYLDDATAAIDAKIARARRLIELLEEYRTRLIADVVTGKLDVRDAA